MRDLTEEIAQLQDKEQKAREEEIVRLDADERKANAIIEEYEQAMITNNRLNSELDDLRLENQVLMKMSEEMQETMLHNNQLQSWNEDLRFENETLKDQLLDSD